MKILDVEQNTTEWEELRRSKIGASDSPVICDKSPWKTPCQLWEEKIKGDKGNVSPAMMRGTMLEGAARKFFAKRRGIDVFPLVVQSDEYDWMIASLDGLSLDGKILVEIKCPNEETMELLHDKKVPETYLYQVQHQLFITDLEFGTLFAFDGVNGIEICIPRDQDVIDEILAKEKAFYDCLVNYTQPKPGKRDVDHRMDDAWTYEAKECVRYKMEMEAAKERFEASKGKLIEMAQGRSCLGGGLSLVKSLQPGRVDYSKIPELEGVDISPYRKPSYESWSVRIQESE